MRLARRCSALALTAGLLLAGAGSATAATPPPPVPTVTPAAPSAYDAPISGMLQQLVDQLANQNGSLDQQWFSFGSWHSADSTCFRCNVGPGVAASTLAADGASQDLGLSWVTFAHAAQANQLANGAFGPYPASEGGPDIQTTFYLPQAGTSLLELGNQVPAAWRPLLVSSVRRGADYLIANGNLSYYTNGNINLGNALAMAVAYQVTGDTKYETAYQQALAFAVAPPQDRWTGFGLTYTKVPTQADGSDGSAFFAERGAGGTGYDPDYTQVQSELLARLYLVTRDTRVLRLLNLEVNQLLQRTDPATAQLDISGGTRLTAPGQTRLLSTPALPVLVWLGGRRDLTPLLTTQLPLMVRMFAGQGSQASAGTYYLVGSVPTTTLQALHVVEHRDHLAPTYAVTQPPLPASPLRGTAH